MRHALGLPMFAITEQGGTHRGLTPRFAHGPVLIIPVFALQPAGLPEIDRPVLKFELSHAF
jgi:hypothetical protein